MEDRIARSAEAIAGADALLIGAGAGMGVDSGLPDFRGNEGFWKEYPPFAKLGLSFADLANPIWFRDDPALAWGFYGHRRNLYRATTPHRGFAILKRWADRLPLGGFVYTSNVDGHFHKAGFDPRSIYEVHGSIGHGQCLVACGADLFDFEADEVAIDPETFRAIGPLPRCPACGVLARPNILMFGDQGWDPSRSSEQGRRFLDWLRTLRGRKIVVVECGAGLAIPTVRRFCEGTARDLNGVLIRINVREPEVPRGQIALPNPAAETLTAIDAALAKDWGWGCLSA